MSSKTTPIEKRVRELEQELMAAKAALAA